MAAGRHQGEQDERISPRPSGLQLQPSWALRREADAPWKACLLDSPGSFHGRLRLTRLSCERSTGPAAAAKADGPPGRGRRARRQRPSSCRGRREQERHTSPDRALVAVGPELAAERRERLVGREDALRGSGRRRARGHRRRSKDRGRAAEPQSGAAKGEGEGGLGLSTASGGRRCWPEEGEGRPGRGELRVMDGCQARSRGRRPSFEHVLPLAVAPSAARPSVRSHNVPCFDSHRRRARSRDDGHADDKAGSILIQHEGGAPSATRTALLQPEPLLLLGDGSLALLDVLLALVDNRLPPRLVVEDWTGERIRRSGSVSARGRGGVARGAARGRAAGTHGRCSGPAGGSR